jgi:hypothetical protein
MRVCCWRAREGVGKRKTKEADALAKIETIEHSLAGLK